MGGPNGLNQVDKADFELMLKAIQNDPGYKLAHKTAMPIDFNKVSYKDFKKIRCRLVKKAVKALYPCLKVSVRQGSGTAHNWVYVLIEDGWKGGVDPAEFNSMEDIRSKSLLLLEQLPIAYATYLTDYGVKDGYEPCLSVECRVRNTG